MYRRYAAPAVNVLTRFFEDTNSPAKDLMKDATDAKAE